MKSVESEVRMRPAIFVMLIAVLVACAPAARLHADTGLASSAQRIDLAGQQRMLVQRIAKASCFVMGDIQAGHHADMAWMAIDLFHRTLAGLRDGDPGAGLEAESDPDIAAQLDVVAGHWRTLQPAALQIIHLDLHRVVMQQVLDLNVLAAEDMNKVVEMMEQASGDHAMSPERARTLNTVGRQGMLSQRLAKEICFVYLGVELATQRAALARTVAKFDGDLADLRQGRNGLLPPSSAAQAQLDRTHGVWLPLRAIAEKALTSQALNADDLAFVAEQSDALLSLTKGTVRAYLPPG